MLSKPIPRWILLGGFLLTGIAGSINAMGFLGIHHQALSHMSGTAAIFSTTLAHGQFSAALHAGMVLLFFFLGCMLSGMIIRNSALKVGRRYGVALAIESVLLFAAAGFLDQGSDYGDCLAAMACGLQNALATTYSRAIIRTTHITGIVTDLGIAAGHFLRLEPVEPRRIQLHLVLLSGFIVGGVLGTWGFLHWSFAAMYIPAAITGLAGVGYTLYRHVFHAHSTK